MLQDVICEVATQKLIDKCDENFDVLIQKMTREKYKTWVVLVDK